MKFPLVRFTVRRLMVAVAVVALALFLAVMLRRSYEYRERALENAEAEQLSMSYADEGRGEHGDPQRVARGKQMAAYHRALRIKYESACWSPWTTFAPDPPEPE
jgi:hypothetical protein